MAPVRPRTDDAAMQHLSGLARLGILGVVLATVAVIGSFAVPDEVGALMRGYGAMLVPAVVWLFAGLALRNIATRRSTDTRTPARAPLRISARDGSLRS
jgi:hypothetical protein